jgi:hypothetical protein
VATGGVLPSIDGDSVDAPDGLVVMLGKVLLTPSCRLCILLPSDANTSERTTEPSKVNVKICRSFILNLSLLSKCR